MKKLMRLVLVVCTVVMFAATLRPTQAAGTFPAIVTMPTQIAGGAAVTITVTNKPPASDAVGLKEWTDEVNRFEKLYPNVTVTGSEYSYAPDSFAALIAGDQVPTMFQVYLTDPQKYIDMGVAADITTIFDANKLRPVFNTDIINLAIKNDKVYGLPYGAYAMGLGYNIPMLKAAGITTPPATWDEVVKDAKLLTNRTAGGRLLVHQRWLECGRLALHHPGLHLWCDPRQHYQKQRRDLYRWLRHGADGRCPEIHQRTALDG